MYRSSPYWVPRTVLGIGDLAAARVDRVWEASEVPPHLTCVWVLTGQCLHGVLVSAMLAANSDARPRQGTYPTGTGQLTSWRLSALSRATTT